VTEWAREDLIINQILHEHGRQRPYGLSVEDVQKLRVLIRGLVGGALRQVSASASPFTPEFYATQVEAARKYGAAHNLDEAEVITFLAGQRIEAQWGDGRVASVLSELLHRTRIDERRRASASPCPRCGK
jgi:hypothetical protein